MPAPRPDPGMDFPNNDHRPIDARHVLGEYRHVTGHDPFEPPAANLDPPAPPAASSAGEVPSSVVALLAETRPWVKLIVLLFVVLFGLGVLALMPVLYARLRERKTSP